MSGQYLVREKINRRLMSKIQKRDINPYIMQRYASYRNITELVVNSTTITDFQRLAQSDSRSRATIGNIGVQ